MLIKFETPTCKFCKSVSEYLDSSNVQYQRVDAIENEKLASKYGIMSVPTVLLLDEDGTVLAQTVGYKPNELDVLIGEEANL